MTDNTVDASQAATRRRRSDAERNITAILDAALACLTRDPDASVADIAQVAGVGRVTLYGHFSSRTELVDAVMARTLAEADATLDSVGLDDARPDVALARMIGSSWHILDQFRTLLLAAQKELPAERIRVHHDRPLRRVLSLLERGQRDGLFRTDLPVPWLVAIFYSVIHGAAEEITAGRLAAADTGRLITATLLAAYTPPGMPVASVNALLSAGEPSGE